MLMLRPSRLLVVISFLLCATFFDGKYVASVRRKIAFRGQANSYFVHASTSSVYVTKAVPAPFRRADKGIESYLRPIGSPQSPSFPSFSVAAQK
jgi:hypothetical protein